MSNEKTKDAFAAKKKAVSFVLRNSFFFLVTRRRIELLSSP